MSRSKTMAPSKDRLALDRLSIIKTSTHALNAGSAAIFVMALVQLGYLPQAWQSAEVLLAINTLVSSGIYLLRKLLSRYD